MRNRGRRAQWAKESWIGSGNTHREFLLDSQRLKEGKIGTKKNPESAQGRMWDKEEERGTCREGGHVKGKESLIREH